MNIAWYVAVLLLTRTVERIVIPDAAIVSLADLGDDRGIGVATHDERVFIWRRDKEGAKLVPRARAQKLCAIVKEDTTQLLCCGKVLQLWHMTDGGRCTLWWVKGKRQVLAAAFWREGREVAAVQAVDRKLLLLFFRSSDGEELRRMRIESAPLKAIVVLDTYHHRVLIGGKLGTVDVYSMTKKEMVRSMKIDGLAIMVAATRRGVIFASTVLHDREGEVVFWRGRDARKAKVKVGDVSPIVSAVAQDGTVVVGGADKHVFVLTGLEEVSRRVECNPIVVGRIRSLCLCDGGRNIAVGDNAGVVRVFGMPSKK